MATRNKGEQISKNEFLKNTYNRKVKITYDRLVLVLKDNINKLSSITNVTNSIIGTVISLMGTIITITTADFPINLEWLKNYVCIPFCCIVTVYYISFFVYFMINRVTIDDVIYELERNNELDEENHIKHKKHKENPHKNQLLS